MIHSMKWGVALFVSALLAISAGCALDMTEPVADSEQELLIAPPDDGDFEVEECCGEDDADTAQAEESLCALSGVNEPFGPAGSYTSNGQNNSREVWVKNDGPSGITAKFTDLNGKTKTVSIAKGKCKRIKVGANAPPITKVEITATGGAGATASGTISWI